jgi:hypothetical protein
LAKKIKEKRRLIEEEKGRRSEKKSRRERAEGTLNQVPYFSTLFVV